MRNLDRRADSIEGVQRLDMHRKAPQSTASQLDLDFDLWPAGCAALLDDASNVVDAPTTSSEQAASCHADTGLHNEGSAPEVVVELPGESQQVKSRSAPGQSKPRQRVRNKDANRQAQQRFQQKKKVWVACCSGCVLVKPLLYIYKHFRAAFCSACIWVIHFVSAYIVLTSALHSALTAL